MRGSRPVEAAIAEKYATLASHRGARWVHRGGGAERVILDGGTLASVAIIDVARRLLTGESGGACLDLGTGDAAFLAYLHATLRIPFHRLHGVSAVEERPAATDVPDTSYHILNLDCWTASIIKDDDHAQASLAQQWLTRTYKMIWSSHTFFHLVDPTAALETAYGRLDANGGVALICHVPLRAVVEDTDPLLLNAWAAREFGPSPILHVSEAPDSPGNYIVLLHRPQQAPPHLLLPLEYTGRVITAAGTYTYATVRPRGTEMDGLVGVSTSSVDFLRAACGVAAVVRRPCIVS